MGLKQDQEAIQYIEQSHRAGSLWSLGFLSDPVLTPLRPLATSSSFSAACKAQDPFGHLRRD
jgi:hypothetical protein